MSLAEAAAEVEVIIFQVKMAELQEEPVEEEKQELVLEQLEESY
jgi:hypothetical protein